MRHALYAAFDRFPSAKGAAIHIDRFSRTLFDRFDGGVLAVLGDADFPAFQREGNVEIVRQVVAEPNFFQRAVRFSRLVDHVVQGNATGLRLCHFRDPWSGHPILARRRDENLAFRTLYEVNALPSCELPSAYPDLIGQTREELITVENFCLEEADHIVVPAATIRAFLQDRGVDGEKITVIPNGADIPDVAPPRPTEAPDHYILYFGALQEWQGIEVLLEAFALLADFPDLRLVLCVSEFSPREKRLRKLSERLGVAGRTIWRRRLDQAELAAWRSHALLAVAPLADCPRNVQQGCSPLKILEAMAAGVPVIASDLPPVREIITDEVTGLLVRPDNPSALARRIRVALASPEKTRRIALAGQELIRSRFTWKMACTALDGVYDALLSSTASVAADDTRDREEEEA